MAVEFGRYRLERWLAQGGMANIFLATYTGPLGFEREVVLKVILPQYAHHSGFITMFLDEARLAARLNHPNIVQVHDLGEARGYHYIAMEYVDGTNLSRAMRLARKQRRSISVGLIHLITGELLEALHYAHLRRDREGRSLGIVHRDVTPQNVLISYDGQVKLTDFGVAKANINLHQTQSGTIKGKYTYMAPEQLRGKAVDGRADIFSVGVMLHEMLTGKPLFKRSDPYEIMKAIMEEPIPRPSEINRRSPPELDGVVLRMLARDPARRYSGALQALEAIDRVVRMLGMVEDRRGLRAFINSLLKRGRNNLAGEVLQGVAVTEDSISEILAGAQLDPAGHIVKPETVTSSLPSIVVGDDLILDEVG